MQNEKPFHNLMNILQISSFVGFLLSCLPVFVLFTWFSFFFVSYYKDKFQNKWKKAVKLVSKRFSALKITRLFFLVQATEEVSKNLVAMKEILYGTNEKEPQTEAVAQLAQELYNSGLLSTLVADLQLIDFEVGKYVLMVISHLNLIKDQSKLFFWNLHA